MEFYDPGLAGYAYKDANGCWQYGVHPECLRPSSQSYPNFYQPLPGCFHCPATCMTGYFGPGFPDHHPQTDFVTGQLFANAPPVSTQSVRKRSALGVEIRNFVCTYPGCTKTYTTSGHLTAHYRKHTGERPFVCTFPFPNAVGRFHLDALRDRICGQRFGRSDEFTRHTRKHFNIRPFECPLCLKRFLRADHCRTHIRRHNIKCEAHKLESLPDSAFRSETSSLLPSTGVVSTSLHDWKNICATADQELEPRYWPPLYPSYFELVNEAQTSSGTFSAGSNESVLGFI